MGAVQVGRGGVGKRGEMSVQSMEEMGKDFCSNLLQHFLENIDRRSSNDGSLEIIPVNIQYVRVWNEGESGRKKFRHRIARCIP